MGNLRSEIKKRKKNIKYIETISFIVFKNVAVGPYDPLRSLFRAVIFVLIYITIIF